MRLALFFSILILINVRNLYAMEVIEPIDLINYVRIQNFSYEADAPEVLSIIKENREALIARENFDEREMLQRGTFNPENDRNNGRAFFKVAKDSKKVLGFIGYTMETAKTGILGIIAVKEQYRKKNIGTQLVQSAGNDLLERGASVILAFVRKNHEVGPHLFNKFAQENNLHLSIAEGAKHKAIANDILAVELIG